MDSQCHTPSAKVPLGADDAPRQAPPRLLLARKLDIVVAFVKANVYGGQREDAGLPGRRLGWVRYLGRLAAPVCSVGSTLPAGSSRAIQEQTAWHSQTVVHTAVDPSSSRAIATRRLPWAARCWVRHDACDPKLDGSGTPETAPTIIALSPHALGIPRATLEMAGLRPSPRTMQ